MEMEIVSEDGIHWTKVDQIRNTEIRFRIGVYRYYWKQQLEKIEQAKIETLDW